jgi:hypothetical protein
MSLDPPRFLTGRHPQRGLLWAAIDPKVNYLEPQVTESRFAAYLAPFPSDEPARQALLTAGADPASLVEERRRRRG